VHLQFKRKKNPVIFYSSIQSKSANAGSSHHYPRHIIISKAHKSIKTQEKKKKTDVILLPDSVFDNGQDSELDCNDTGSDAIKRISTFNVRFD